MNSGFSCSRLRPLMGTFVSVDARAADPVPAGDAVSAAYEAIQQVATRMHPDAPGSDLALIGRAVIGQVIRVHAWTWAVLEFSSRLHRLSAGIFDPCLPGAGVMSDLSLPCPGEVVKHREVRLDVGGVAKGFAVDCAIDALRTAHCSGGLVNAGGDLRVFGTYPPAVLIRAHEGGGAVRNIALRNAACAVSDPSASAGPAEHRGYYRRVHSSQTTASGMDPLSHSNARMAGATVIAPTAMAADALTKCVMLCPPAQAKSILREFGARAI